jgi:hypothetical protein
MASADNIYIMGPGEAKDELCKHLEKAGLSMRICTVEAAQRLSGRQIVARVKEYFNKVPARSY